MRHATAILIAASLTAAAAHAVAFQEPAPPPAAVPSPAPAAIAAAAPSDVKVAGRDVPAPKRTRFVSPVFPLEAQAAGQRGIVIIELVIDEAGKVSTADVLRSVPPFDEAALTAARQWEYEITKVDGKAVPVRLTVPITFALKLPEMTREAGIPELRQGASPFFPIGAKGPAKVVADVTLLPDGTVAEAAIREGDSPYAEAMLQTLRTWRFASEAEAPPVAFQVRAEFAPGPPPKVELKLSGLRTAERRPAAAPTPGPTPAAVPTPAARHPTPAAAPTPAAVPSPAVLATPAPALASPLPPRPTPNGPGAAASTATPPPPVLTTPGAAAPRPEGVRPSPVVPTPPPVEVIPGGPPPGAAPGATSVPAPGDPAAVPSPQIESGVSAVRDIALGPGVPDLTKGRRPVAPPLARMSSLSGSVQIQFSVDASGASSIQNVSGPDLLKEAARQAVATWTFRRTSAERIYLVATFNYDGDKAQAEVRRAE